MTEVTQPIFLRAKYFDFAFAAERLVGVVQIARDELGYVSQWWVSGFATTKRFGLLLQVQIAVAGETEFEALVAVRDLIPTILLLAKKSAETGGVTSPFISPEPQIRKRFVLEHLEVAFSSGIFESIKNDLMLQTAIEYGLCTSFGLNSQIETLAEFHNLPTSTISRRVARARDLGLIAKPRQEQKGSGD